VADYYWIQALGLVGGASGAVEEHADVIGDLVELVTTLDPWVDHPYRFGAVWLTRDVAEVRRANAMLERGISYHPGDWRNRFYLGYNYFFYLHDNQRAADVLEPAVAMDGSPRYLGAFVTRLRADGGDLETAAIYLRELIQGTNDEYARATYLKAYDEVETELRARYLDAARAEFWKRNGRDIRSPSELWEGKHPIVRVVPPAHPHFPGLEWVIDPESGEIVSSFYGSRYQLHVHSLDVRRRAHWRSQLEEENDREEGAESAEVRSEGRV
jgi:tetratricopeptide (TPR) repeat protein